MGRPLTIGVLVAAVTGVSLGLHWFQPWKLWQDETVQEALPGAVAPAPPPAGTSSVSITTVCSM
ncbi:hypothetical protein GCM10010103_55560 [Streptomyces paradoxus]|uniref:Electron transporter n=1 Tax=Streptomyces paradoxus TaxID=66375 RepID=A0A7W9TEW3_9ACTN|nr:hypothetical protein [Streptomyces paradoxus]